MEKRGQNKNISMSNTKKEMLDAYNALLRQIEATSEEGKGRNGSGGGESEPWVEERGQREPVLDLLDDINDLKMEVTRVLNGVAERIEEQSRVLARFSRAVKEKEEELKELYGIERKAVTLSQLAEEEKRKRREYEEAMLRRKEELAAREEALRQREEEFLELRRRVAEAPKEMEAAVERVAAEVEHRVRQEERRKLELLKRDFEGERKELQARIEGLERLVREQEERIAKLSEEQARGYERIQAIAIKAIEGSLSCRNLVEFPGEVREAVESAVAEE